MVLILLLVSFAFLMAIGDGSPTVRHCVPTGHPSTTLRATHVAPDVAIGVANDVAN